MTCPSTSVETDEPTPERPLALSDNHASFSGLIDLLTTTIETGTWDVDGGSGTIGTEENTLSLVIGQTGSTRNEQVADLLKQLRKLQDLQVTVEVRFMSVSRQLL